MARRIFSISIIAGFMLLMALLFSRQSAYALTATVTLSRTPTLGCGSVVVVTSTPSPTLSPTPRVATATTTPSCGVIYITATPGVVLNGPDLIIANITYAGSNPSCANAPKNNVVVTNNGNAAAGTFSVSYGSSGMLTLVQTVNGLAAGQSITLSFPSASGAGMAVTVTADSTNAVAETNESNNTTSAILPIPTQAPTCTPTGPTNTPTRTITPTNQCMMTTVPMIVSPVTSPTSALTQVINVTLSGGSSVTITSQAGTFTSTTRVGNVFSVTINLVANTTNNLSIVGTVPASGGCAGYSLTATATIVQASNIITATPTVTRTPTRTPTRTFTPTACGCVPPPCSTPVAITAPFAKDGAGTFCWQISTMTSHVNSWNTTSVTVNTMNVTNAYVPVSSLPAKINGNWIIAYNASVPWAHFEAK